MYRVSRRLSHRTLHATSNVERSSSLAHFHFDDCLTTFRAESEFLRRLLRCQPAALISSRGCMASGVSKSTRLTASDRPGIACQRKMVSDDIGRRSSGRFVAHHMSPHIRLRRPPCVQSHASSVKSLPCNLRRIGIQTFHFSTQSTSTFSQQDQFRFYFG